MRPLSAKTWSLRPHAARMSGAKHFKHGQSSAWSSPARCMCAVGLPIDPSPAGTLLKQAGSAMLCKEAAGQPTRSVWLERLWDTTAKSCIAPSFLSAPGVFDCALPYGREAVLLSDLFLLRCGKAGTAPTAPLVRLADCAETSADASHPYITCRCWQHLLVRTNTRK